MESVCPLATWMTTFCSMSNFCKHNLNRVVLIVACAGPAWAQEPAPPATPPAHEDAQSNRPVEAPESPTADAQEEVPATEMPAPTGPLPGPKFFALSYASDWSYLDGPEGSYEPDLFDPLKNIDLGNDWRLDFGGSIRFRLMGEENKLYGGRRPTQDTYLLQQYRLHANLRYKDVIRFFIEGIHADAVDRDTPTIGIDQNHIDFNQMFLDFKLFGSESPFMLRVGRQELLYGSQRLVSPLMWANTRRRFDGATLMYRDENWNIDGFYVRPVPVNRSEGLENKPDEYNEDQHFFGIYSTYKGWDRHGLDVYYLVLLDSDPQPNSAGLSDHLTLHTFGSRWWGKTGPWDYEAEGAIQLGHHSGDRVCAWMVAVEGGYTFKEVPMNPRVSLGFDWATGDRDPDDNTHGTFNHLFPLGHKYLGILDQVGRQNIITPHVAVRLEPCKPVALTVAYHYFWLDSNDDALYNAGGAPGRRDRLGGSGSSVGGELDVKLTWKINVHQAFEFGYAHMWPGSFIKRTGDDDSPDFFYFQYVFNF